MRCTTTSRILALGLCLTSTAHAFSPASQRRPVSPIEAATLADAADESIFLEPSAISIDGTRLQEDSVAPALNEPSQVSVAIPMDPPAARKKSGSHALPQWGQAINKFLELPLITHADKKHVHAIAGASWYIGGFALLWSSFVKEFFWDDWSSFAHFDGLVPIVCLGAVVTTATNSHMQPQKRLSNYSDFMRNGMVYGASLALASASYAIDPAMIPQPLSIVAQVTMVGAMIKLLEDLIVDRAPIDISHVIEDLTLEAPPKPVFWFTVVLSLFVVAESMTCLAHVAGQDWSALASQDSSGMATAFASQLALAVSMGPAGDALIGTLMAKDRFNNKTGKYTFLRKDAEGKFRNRIPLDIYQIIFHFGPGMITILLALMTNHADVVERFFYLS